MSLKDLNLTKASEWLDGQKVSSAVFYTSVDLRRGSGRICPVDVNCFPAGFNNLCPNDAAIAPEKFLAALERSGAKKGAAVGVIAESHTRNIYYADHLHSLVGIIRNAGYRAEASCPECADDVQVRSASGQVLSLLPINRREDKIVFGKDFIPDFLLLNNDLAGGLPLLLKNISQPMVPPADLGWFRRRKHRFFEVYANLAGDFARAAGIDPRSIVPRSVRVADIDFKNKTGLDRVAESVETVLAESRRWNEEHHISETPAAIIKSNYGTYGMAVMSVTSANEVLNMNRKTVNKMHIGKGKVQTVEVLVQEGIPTDDTVDDCPAEPVVYLVEGRPIGAFYRHHCERGNKYNLNVSGMAFKTICLRDLPPGDMFGSALSIARLAALAVVYE